jgi:nicotinate-nucleotide pyrophosphorylase (carboxylating)
MTMTVSRKEIRSLVARALKEDRAGEDATVSFLSIGEARILARLVTGAPGVIAGMEVAHEAFRKTDPHVLIRPAVADGQRIAQGDVLGEIEGSAVGILTAERVALNFLQRLSGVATLTAAYVEAVRGSGVTILDTRKTTPFLRSLEKYAVRMGGGENHRMGLDEMVLIKENHLRTVGGLKAVEDRLKAHTPARPIEVEVEDIKGIRALLGMPVDRIMLDNFSPHTIRAAVEEIAAYRREHPGFSPGVEVSGGIGLENIRRYAVPGVDFISVGALTHSAPALDISLEVVPDGG